MPHHPVYRSYPGLDDLPDVWLYRSGRFKRHCSIFLGGTPISVQASSSSVTANGWRRAILRRLGNAIDASRSEHRGNARDALHLRSTDNVGTRPCLSKEHSPMAKSMEIVPSGELQKQFGRYSDEAMIRPVGVSRNGRVRFIMVPVDEYERLRRRERVAGRVEDLDDETLEAIRAVEPGRGSEEVEKRLNAA
jgi:hypothetical protein